MQVVLIGIGCMIMAIMLFATDPFDYQPDPWMQGMVWAGFAIWCFAVAWHQRDWRPPPDRDRPD